MSIVILEPRGIKSISTFPPSICHEVIELHAVILVFFFSFLIELKVSFFTLPFTLIKRVFSYASLSPIFRVSTTYLRLLIFLPAVLIPDYNSVRPAILMMYPAYKLNKQGQNIQPCCTAFPV